MIQKNHIKLSLSGETYQIPNAWELLSMDQYLNLSKNLNKMATGELSAAMVRVFYVCDVMGWAPNKIKDEDALCNLSMIADQVTFIFNIQYPAGTLDAFSTDEQSIFKKTPPENVKSATARYLSKLDYHYVVDSCFCAQLIPTIHIGSHHHHGYKIDTKFGALTCTLGALQYLDAQSLIECKNEYLPLLASILYQPAGEKYSSYQAHKDADQFAKLSEEILQAIAFNFICLNNYLFRNTHFSLLTAGEPKPESPISVGAIDSLYNMSTDGYGDVNTVEQMNIMQYLTINRKKLIDSVKSMIDAKIKLPDIATTTGLPLSIINDIMR